MRFIRLTEEDLSRLTELQKISKSHVIRRRCLCLLLSDNNISAFQVSRLAGVHRNTADTLFNKWDSADGEQRLAVLLFAKCQGAKVKLAPVADLLPQLVEKYSRNLKPILETLKKEHSTKVSKLTLQNFLKNTQL